MKKIMSICMVVFTLTSVGCSKSDEIVRKMEKCETLEILNEKLMNTETIVEAEDGGFNTVIKAIEDGIVEYDNLYKQVNEFIDLAESKKMIDIAKSEALEEEIENSRTEITGTRDKILTYNKKFNEYWIGLTDAYIYLKAALHNINTLSINGTVENAKDALSESKENFDSMPSSRENIKEEIINQ